VSWDEVFLTSSVKIEYKSLFLSSCKVVFLIFQIHTIFQSVIIKKRLNSKTSGFKDYRLKHT